MKIVKIIIIFLPILFIFHIQTVYANQIEGKTVKIDIRQTYGNLQLNKISVLAENPGEYKLNLNRNYYRFQLLDKNGLILSEGKISSVIIPLNIPFDDNSNLNQPPPQIKFVDEIELFLPLFSEVKNLNMYDEHDLLKLNVDLSDYIPLYYLLPTITPTNTPPTKDTLNSINFMGIKLGRINPTQSFQMIWDLINKIIRF